ncbi:DNA primase [Clostridia bacterium]|nr:DNA primase [Clostridia bacterium]
MKMRYSAELIEEIRVKSDIVQVISSYVNLTKKGREYVGLCPFHQEKSPSFSVSEQKQMFYCFGCGAGGNVYSFLMAYENYSFVESLQALAQRTGIALPEESEQGQKQLEEKEILFTLNKIAARYFHFQLKSQSGQVALSYLENRGLTAETIVQFGLGYSLKYKEDLYVYLKRQGFDDAILKESGLVEIRETGSIDKFWNRIMFPIMDIHRKVIGFGARSLGEAQPKYLNSKETKLFDKSRNLYGLHQAKNTKEDYLILCEGYMDVITLSQAGFSHAVASLGTALTIGQANLLKRYTNQIVIAYDSDTAGVKASLRAIPLLQEVGLSVRVVDLSPFKDPDELIKAKGSDFFLHCIQEAVSSFLFEIRTKKKEYALDDPEQKTQFYQFIAQKLVSFREKLERQIYLEAVAKDQEISLVDLESFVNRFGNEIRFIPAKREKKVDKKNEKEESEDKPQRLLLIYLLEHPQWIEKISFVLLPTDFINPFYREIAEVLFAKWQEGIRNPAQILNYLLQREEKEKEITALFKNKIEDSISMKEQEKSFVELVKKVKKQHLEIIGKEVKNMEELQEIMQAQADLDKLHISLEQG